MKLFSLAPLAAILLTNGATADNGNYWWMNQPDAFGGNGGGGGHNSGSSQGFNNGNQHSGNGNNYGSSSDFSSNSVQTECPAGTKCVSDHFCDENAIMVNYRVNLTPAQKRNRGDLIPCTLGSGQFDVCCSTSGGVGAAPLPINTGGNFNNNNNQGRGSGFNSGNSFSSSSSSGGSGAAPAVGVGSPIRNDPNFFSCPNVAHRPIEQCQQAESNCWSLNLFDVDCPNNAPCCYDGCRNACYFGPGSSSAPQSSNRPANNNNNRPAPRQPAPAPAPRPSRPQPVRRPQNGFNTGNNRQTSSFNSGSNSGSSVTYPQQPQPSVQIPVRQQPPRQQARPQPPRQQARPQPPRQQQNYNPAPQQQFQQPQQQFQQPRPQRQQGFSNNNNFQGSGPVQQGGNPSDELPFVMCPSAMLCVTRNECDPKGVIAPSPINRTPAVEAVSVPLISCIHPDDQSIGVCCRDPNYVDPWPQNGNGGHNHGNKGGNGNGGNNGFRGNNGFNNGNNQQFAQNPSNQGNGFNSNSGHHGNSAPKRRNGYGK